MKISDLDLPKSQEIKPKKAGKSSGASKTDASSKSPSASSGVTDSVSVSEAGKQMRVLKSRYEAIPDEIRTERLAALKNEVDAGSYHPPADQIANAIIDFVQLR